MILTALKIPLEVVTEGANLILLEVNPYYQYQNGVRSNEIEGYRYTVVEEKKYEKFSVKIPSTAPAFTNEQIASAKAKIYVTFVNGIAKPYRTQSGEYALSISASSVSTIK